MTKKDAEKLKRIMRERDEDNGGEPLNAVDRGYHLACEHLYEEIDKLIDEQEPPANEEREKAIKGLKENLCCMCSYGSQDMDSCDIRGCDDRDYIKALEQESCENAISRTDMLDAVGHGTTYTSEEVQNIVNSLPPVAPQPIVCEDAIDRKALMSLIESEARRWGELYDADQMLGDIEDFPSVTPTQKWIPVSERPPEELTPVNITWVNRNPEPYYKDIKDKPFTATGVYYKGKWYWYSSTCEDYLAEYGRNEVDRIDASIEVTAWMPLIEAYKESEQHGNSN